MGFRGWQVAMRTGRVDFLPYLADVTLSILGYTFMSICYSSWVGMMEGKIRLSQQSNINLLYHSPTDSLYSYYYRVEHETAEFSSFAELLHPIHSVCGENTVTSSCISTVPYPNVLMALLMASSDNIFVIVLLN